MAGELAIVERKAQKPNVVMADGQWRWKVQYSRCFFYPYSFLSNKSSTLPFSPSLSAVDKKNFKPTWISAAASSAVSLQPSDHSSADSILTVSLEGTILEEHYISKLNFVWPQVSCLSGFPARGSLVVIASYTDSADEKQKQKFALRFTTVSAIQEFLTMLENILSDKIPNASAAVDVISAISSQSEFVPPYRPDTSSIMTPIDASCEPNSHNVDQQESPTQTQDTVADSESNVVAFPPRFTSLVSDCSAEAKQSDLAITLASELQEPDLKAQIAKYMQDASFLDMVNKVNDVITELGGDYVI